MIIFLNVNGVNNILFSSSPDKTIGKRITEYFQFTAGIGKLIYTTNTVEGYYRQFGDCKLNCVSKEKYY